jgi:hypothetical protein
MPPNTPLADRFQHAPGEQPLGHPVGVQIEQVRHAPGQTSRVSGQPLVAVEHVLQSYNYLQ